MASVNLVLGTRLKLQVQMTPAKTLAQALGEFCKKFDLDSAEHSLTHNKKTLDLALPWRLAGISANATLEVKKSAAPSKAGTSPQFDAEPAQIQVAVTLETGRHVMSFSNNISIWDLLKIVEVEKSITILSTSWSKKMKDGQVVTLYNQPIVNVLTTELGTNTDLRKTTLSTLGVKSGSAVLRIRFKPTETPLVDFLQADALLAVQEADDARATEQRIQDSKLAQEQEIKEQKAKLAQMEEQARVQAEEREKALQASLAEKQAKEEADFQRSMALAQAESLRTTESASSSAATSTTAMDVDQSGEPSKKRKFEVVVEPPGPPGMLKVLLEGGMIDEDFSRMHDILRQGRDEVEIANRIPSEPCDRAARVYAPSTTPFDPSTLELPDDFFEVLSEDLSKMKHAPPRDGDVLKTKAMRDRERLQKLSKFKKCFIRFRFPDRMELQGTFYPQEGLTQLNAFLREHLANPNLQFHLFTTPPTTPVHPTKNLRDQNFLPAALVQVGLDKGANAVSPFLKPESLALIEEKTYTPIVQEYKSTTEIKMVTPQTQEAAASSSSAMDVDLPPAHDSANQAAKPGAAKQKDPSKVPKWFAAGMKKK